MGFSPDDLASAANNPNRPRAPKPKAGTSVIGVVIALVVMVSLIKTCREDSAPPVATELAKAVKAMQPQLPIENPKGVFTEQVLAEGRDMVFVIRDSTIHKADTTAEQLAAWKKEQKQLLVEGACAQKASRDMLDLRVNVKRRFVDAGRQPLFEVELTAADCKTAAR